MSRAFCGVVIADPATKTAVIDREYRRRKASTEDVVEGKLRPQEETGRRNLRDEKQPSEGDNFERCGDLNTTYWGLVRLVCPPLSSPGHSMCSSPHYSPARFEARINQSIICLECSCLSRGGKRLGTHVIMCDVRSAHVFGLFTINEIQVRAHPLLHS